jgi:formylglycine-generating enzyme required for sulfatase activity/outer membrane protein OmpA-like peptidoglycan-associated protein
MIRILFTFFLLASLLGQMMAGAADAQRLEAGAPAMTPEELTRQLETMIATEDGDQELRFDVRFSYDKAIIEPPFAALLDALGRVMGAAPVGTRFMVGLEGHASNPGSNEYNKTLSNRRAKAVSLYLDSQFGTLPTAVVAWGEERPLRKDDTPASRQLNRRVMVAVKLFKERALLARMPAVFINAHRLAVRAMEDHSLEIWDFMLDCPQRILAGHENAVLSLDTSPNGRLLLSSSADTLVKVWDVATGRELQTLRGHVGAVNDARFTRSGRHVISIGEDGLVKLFDLESSARNEDMVVLKEPVRAMAMSADERWLMLGSSKGEVIVWDRNTGQKLWSTMGHKGAVTAVVPDPSGRFVLSSGEDGQLKMWGVLDGNLLKSHQSGSAIQALALQEDGVVAVFGTTDGRMVFWHIPAWKVSSEETGFEGTVRGLHYARGGMRFLASGMVGGPALWDAHTSKLIRHPSPAGSAATPGKGEYAGQSWIEPGTGIEFIWVPGGCYPLGCGDWTRSCRTDEHPLHEVCVKGTWVGRTEVTRLQWRDLMKTNPSRIGPKIKYENLGFWQGLFRSDEDEARDAATLSERLDGFPVDQVSWDDAQGFVCRLRGRTGLNFRLPTEAEWEYACRSQGETEFDEISDPNPHDDVLGRVPRRGGVEEESANALGIRGMNGGVWEWTQDLYLDAGYHHHQRNDPVFSGDRDYLFLAGEYPRVHRGGSWNRGFKQSRCGHREYAPQMVRAFFSGFRVVLEP